MPLPDRRRSIIDALKAIPAKHKAWINLPVSVEGFELFCYHGWGVVPNDAQLEGLRDILTWPAGAFHLWRWGNRTGKTTGLMLDHEYICFKKWRYEQQDLDAWLGYKYKTLHAAPEGILMSKAWEIADSLIEGSAIIQRNPLTNRQRPGIFVASPMFKATTQRDATGQEQLVVLVANGAKVDFLQTYSGAGRMESDAWWFIDWDEFGEHKPIGNVPYLVDSTFLPRSSDFMAPVVLSSTEKETNAAVYMELEDLADRSPNDWNVKEFGRETNFAMSKASIDRQIRMSSDVATAQRSVYGGSAESSKGSVLPMFTVRRAFDTGRPAHRVLDDLPLPQPGKRWKLIQSFDHAIQGDRNVVLTSAVQWPITDREELIAHPIEGLAIAERKGSRVLTPDEVSRWAVRQWLDFGAQVEDSVWITDTTGEGGIMFHRILRAAGIPSREFNYTARVGKNDRRTKKAHGRTGLQRLFSLGLPVDEETGEIIVPAGTDIDALEFGGIRFPLPGPDTEEGRLWRKLWRQLAILKVDDEKMAQDHAMTALMTAGFIYPYIERPMRQKPIAASILGRRSDRYRGLARLR